MKQLKIPVLFVSLLLSCTNVFSQVSQEKTTTENSVTPAQLAQYRLQFWDSLPNAISWISDFAGLFTKTQRNYMDSIMADFEKNTTTEIGIITLDTFCTEAAHFEDLALHFAQTWGIGKKDINNGILICISPGYRRIRICNGSGILQYLSDEETQQIINEHILIEYKNGDYFAGTSAGLLAIIAKLYGPIKKE